MTFLINLLFLAPALLAFTLALFFAVEVAGAFLAPPRRATGPRPRPLALVVPAHNEAGVIRPTLENLKSQLAPGDRIIVIADNCHDATAEIAARAGATVLVRTDKGRRGKGYALQHAIDHLKDSPPAAIVIVDADCRLEAGALDAIGAEIAATGRPAQMLYLMHAPDGAPPQRRVAAFAWLLMNRVRMSGLYRLFGATRLTGSGMAFPWQVAASLDLASGEIVEDLALSTRLIEDGNAPTFRDDAVVSSFFPVAEEGAVTQHARWEHGSLRLAAARAPKLFWRALGKGDIRLAAAALDLAIPPLVLFLAALMAVAALSLVPLLWGYDAPFALAFWALLLVVGGAGAAWVAFGRTALPPSALGAALSYVAGKARVYGASARASTKGWTRTKRDGDDATDAAP